MLCKHRVAINADAAFVVQPQKCLLPFVGRLSLSKTTTTMRSMSYPLSNVNCDSNNLLRQHWDHRQSSRRSAASPRNPFPNERGTIPELDALRFAHRQKVHCVEIDESHLLEIECNPLSIHFCFHLLNLLN
jgi:hypothetical protein